MNFMKQISIAALAIALFLGNLPAFAVDDYYLQQQQYQQMLKQQRELQKRREPSRVHSMHQEWCVKRSLQK
jgi:invasion protein IalB